jgi:hypothetical protein
VFGGGGGEQFLSDQLTTYTRFIQSVVGPSCVLLLFISVYFDVKLNFVSKICSANNKVTGYIVWIFYEGVSNSFWIGRLERELQMVQLSVTRCSYIAILWVSLASFAAAITLCVASQRVFIIVVYFVIESVRKLLDTSSYVWYVTIFFGMESTWRFHVECFLSSACSSPVWIQLLSPISIAAKNSRHFTVTAKGNFSLSVINSMSWRRRWEWRYSSTHS